MHRPPKREEDSQQKINDFPQQSEVTRIAYSLIVGMKRM